MAGDPLEILLADELGGHLVGINIGPMLLSIFPFPFSILPSFVEG